MGLIGFLALLANLLVAILLFAYRNGDANMRSVWLCTRNDVVGNIAVMLAALGVLQMSSGWPDIAVATIMSALALTAARSVIVQAKQELAATSVIRSEPEGLLPGELNEINGSRNVFPVNVI